MSVTTVQQQHFSETNFIILTSFSLYHVKAAIIIKRATRNSYWDRTNVGSGGIAPSRWRHGGSGGRSPSAGRFLRLWAMGDFYESDVILGIFELKFLLQNILER